MPLTVVVWWMFSLQYGALLLTWWLYQFWSFLYIYNKKIQLKVKFVIISQIFSQIKEQTKAVRSKCFVYVCKEFSDRRRYFSWSTHLMFTVTWFNPSWSFQQEVSQCYDREKHTQVDEEERPATAIQPVSRRTLSAPRSVPAESRQSAFVQS